MWSIVDLLIIIFNGIIILSVYLIDTETETLRVFEAFLCIFMWSKSLYYLGLVGEIAPLVDIIFVIVNDIKYFMVIYLIALIAFINAFYIIGKNQ